MKFKMLLKQTVASVMALLLCVVSVPFVSLAAGTGNPVLSITANDVVQGDTFTTTLYYEKGSSICRSALKLYYDEDMVELVSCVNNEDALVDSVINTTEPGVINISFATSRNLSAELKLVDITFKVSEDMSYGEYDLLTLAPSCTAQRLSSDNVAEEVTIQNNVEKLNIYCPGDMNLDGKVDGTDAVYILRYEAGLDSGKEGMKFYLPYEADVEQYSEHQKFILKIADAHFDGKVDGSDAVTILRYEAGFKEQLGNRVNVVFLNADGSVFAIKSIEKGKGLSKIPDVPGDEHSANKWSLSGSSYVEPNFDCVTEAMNIYLFEAEVVCTHNDMQATVAKAETCTEDGNIAYWHCPNCGLCFADAEGKTRIDLGDTVIKAHGHTVVIDEAVPATETSKGLTEGSHCSECHKVLVAQEEYGPLAPTTGNITYRVAYTEITTKNGTKTIVADDYIASQTMSNPNPNTYSFGVGVAELEELTLDGYDFLGWFESPEVGAKRVYGISADATGNQTVYGIWSEKTYTVTYKLYQTPLEDTIDSKYCSYTVSKGLPDLPNPTINNYVFLGWYTNDGQEMTEIPVGTSGNIVLNAYWTSKRNIAKYNPKYDDPIILEDTDNGVLYFTYELGTIENIPLSGALWTIQSVSGLAQQKSETFTTSLTQTKANAISDTISNSTVDSGTWTLAEGWTDSTSVTEEWAEQHQTTVEEANEKCKTSSNTFSATSSSGGSGSTTTTDGTTTLDYNSQNYTHGNSAELGAKISGSYDNKNNLSSKIAGNFSISAEVSGKYEQHQETNEHTGTDTTTVHTKVGESTSTWNSSSSASSTQTASEKQTVKQAISDIISSKNGYGNTYTKNGQNSETQGFSNTASNSVNSSSTLTWSSVETKTVTNTYSTDGKSEGCYRLVIAGKAHVFGVVGYDIATHSYFTYTYSVMDDEQYEFLDYSPDLNFNDCENGVLPFEIPYFVHEYSMRATVRTEGLTFRTNSTNKTATVVGYDGESSDVTIPNYISAGGVAYKVTDIAADVFAGKDVRAVNLSKFIEELPAGAFKNCTKLEQISGYYDVIGAEAFSGCTSLENYNVTAVTKAIGEDAFLGVSSIRVNVIASEYALEVAENDETAAQELTQQLIDSALNSGAKKVVLCLDQVIDGEWTLNVPELDYFELIGSADSKNIRTFRNLKLSSKAAETVLKNLRMSECTRIPLEISSSNVTLDMVDVSSTGYCLLLSDTANISLVRDNKLTSQSGKAVVCKEPTFASVSKDSVAGYLEVSGNVYVFGTITGKNNVGISNGEWVSLTEEEFNNYIKGSYTVTFDVNGGDALAEPTKTVYYGGTYGELPVPTKEYYTFDGWFTEAESGTEVTADTIVDTTEEVTVYAHWTQNPLSDWVRADELPEGATVENTKWTYTQRSYTTNAKSSLDGWTKYDTQRTSWGEKQGPVYSNPTDGKRNVTSEQYVASYNYKTVYRYYCYSSTGSVTSGSHSYMQYDICQTRVPLELDYELSYGGQLNGNYMYNGYWVWKDNPYTTQVATSANYATRWYYQEPVYTYYYYQDNSMESMSYPSGDDISDVVEMVQYRMK